MRLLLTSLKTRQSIDPKHTDTDHWAKVELSAITSERRRKLCERNCAAITAYFANRPVNVICREFRISRPELKRLRDRCIAPHPDKQIWGYRACIPYKRSKPYLRRNIDQGRSKAGLLDRIFRLHPEIFERLTRLYLKQVDGCNESRIPIQGIHTEFIKLCRGADLPRNGYPFNTKFLGIRGLADYLYTHAFLPHYQTAMGGRNGEKAAEQLATGIPFGAQPTSTLAPLQRVDADEHKIDSFGIIEVPHPAGGFVDVVVDRLWIIIFKDHVTRAALGCLVSLNVECTADDFLEAAHAAIVPWKPRPLSIPGLEFPKGGGFPSGVIPETEWAVWSELLLDNSRAHLAQKVRIALEEKLGCSVNYGPIATPERRAFIERFFRSLEERGFHRLPSTTGSNPLDPRRSNPEKQALSYRIKLDALMDLVEVLCAEFNGTPHSGLLHRTPLEQLQYYIEEERVLIRKISPPDREKFNLLEMRRELSVRGSQRRGRRPYVNFMGERYSNEVLARSFELIGTNIVVIVSANDIRTMKAFLPDGSDLGILCALGKWRFSRHDLKSRLIANRLRNRRIVAFSENKDPVQVVINHLAESALTNKRDAKRFARLAKVTGPSANAIPSEETEPNDAPAATRISKYVQTPAIQRRMAINL